MADQKISALTAASTPLAGTEVLPIVQSGTTVKVAVSNLTAGRAVSALSITSTNDATINGMTIGKGGGAVTTNTALGFGTLATAVAGGTNVAIGYQAMQSGIVGDDNIAIGVNAGRNITGSGNTSTGRDSLVASTGSNNTAIGFNAGSTATTGSNNGFFGNGAAPSSVGVSNEYTYGNSSVTSHRFTGGNLTVVTSGKGILLPGGITWTSGAGSPESVVTAPVGSLYSRSDGGLLSSLYVKESGSGNTGWAAK